MPPRGTRCSGAGCAATPTMSRTSGPMRWPVRPSRDNACVLELFQGVLGTRHGEGTGLFDVQLLHDAVVDDHRVTLAAPSHAEARRIELEAHGTGEIAIAVGQHHDLVADALV